MGRRSSKELPSALRPWSSSMLVQPRLGTLTSASMRDSLAPWVLNSRTAGPAQHCRRTFGCCRAILPPKSFGARSSPTTSRPASRAVTSGRDPDGLRDFLAARAGFVDEEHDVEEVLAHEDLPSGEVRIKTRLKFSLRQSPGDQLFTGTAFHTWLLRRDDAGQWRVAAQIVDGFADLNDNAKRLFATPDAGLNR